VIENAVIAGTASALGSGSFANGAITGAFVVLFNHVAHEMRKPQEAIKVEPEKKGVTNNSKDPIRVRLEKIDQKTQKQWRTIPSGHSYIGEYDGVEAHGVIIKVSNWSDLHIVVTQDGFEYDALKMYNNTMHNLFTGILKLRRINTVFPADDPPVGWDSE
jgi:hypothetical protein